MSTNTIRVVSVVVALGALLVSLPLLLKVIVVAGAVYAYVKAEDLGR